MDPLVIPVVAILMPLFLVPTMMILKHRHGRREWEHRERMKAMEMGMGMPLGQCAGAAKSIAAIGGAVPVAAVVMAFMTCAEGPPSVDGMPLAAIVWPAAALISGGAFLTSLVMAFLTGRPRTTVNSADSFQSAKPIYDPDAFDVVSSRA